MTITQITTDYGITHTDKGWLPYNLAKQQTFGFPSATEAEATEKVIAQQARMDAAAAEEAEKAASAEAEAAKLAKLNAEHEAYVNQTATSHTTTGLATPRQVNYILSLIARGAHEEGGYYNGPTTRAGVEQMTKASASTYIDSLTSRY